jgi:hypothetical protein
MPQTLFLNALGIEGAQIQEGIGKRPPTQQAHHRFIYLVGQVPKESFDIATDDAPMGELSRYRAVTVPFWMSKTITIVGASCLDPRAPSAAFPVEGNQPVSQAGEHRRHDTSALDSCPRRQFLNHASASSRGCDNERSLATMVVRPCVAFARLPTAEPPFSGIRRCPSADRQSRIRRSPRQIPAFADKPRRQR